MPLFEYKCESCNKHYDALQKYGDIVLITCPYCKEDTLKKLFSAPQFTLTGEGFHKPGKHQ